jgi:hypothetical protein
MKKQKRKRKGYLLFRIEGDHKVWLYEELRKYELDARLRNGWKLVM